MVAEGALEKMVVRPGAPAEYRLALREPNEVQADLDLNSFLGKELRLEFNGQINCGHCARVTRKSYGEGFCYPCFRRLAQCDLCVVSPARCHYAAGTCREPEWGEAFCMQPHLVYLANASGAKVGLTRRHQEVTRWLDQGAVQGLVIAAATTRHLAGLLEAALARHVSDRTDWRAMVRGDPPPLDLPALREHLRELVALPEGVAWLDATVHEMSYPVMGYPSRVKRLRLESGAPVVGRLVGIKGQYLLFDHGVFNVRQHRSHRVRLTVSPLSGPDLAVPTGMSEREQLDLFG
jgi:hypothetical protein